jgi:hypothetical protein
VKISFKDRFQHQLHRRLHYAILHRRDPEWPSTSLGFRDIYSSHRLKAIALGPQLFLLSFTALSRRTVIACATGTIIRQVQADLSHPLSIEDSDFLLFKLGAQAASSVIFSVRGVRLYSRYMPNSGAKRSRKMVTIHNLQEMKAAAQGNDPQTKLLVLGLGEAIVTTCGQARMFLEKGGSFGDEPKST